MEDLAALLSESDHKHVFVFKHSTRCPVSSAANREYYAFSDQSESEDSLIFGHVDLIQNRDVSDAIAEKLSIPHQSPQAILVKGGKAIWNASHGNITQKALESALLGVDTAK